MLKDLFKSNRVTVGEASSMVEAGDAVLVDVRTRQEWKEGHPPEALHISLASLETQMRRIPDDRIVLAICRSGSRSARAVAALQRAGFDARNVKGGMIAWDRAGLRTTRR